MWREREKGLEHRFLLELIKAAMPVIFIMLTNIRNCFLFVKKKKEIEREVSIWTTTIRGLKDIKEDVIHNSTSAFLCVSYGI